MTTDTKQALEAVAGLVGKWRAEADPKAERFSHPDACEALNGAADELEATLPALLDQVVQLQAALVEEMDQELEMFGSGAVAQIATESLRDWRDRLAGGQRSTTGEK